jgi:hypothetical protein
MPPLQNGWQRSAIIGTLAAIGPAVAVELLTRGRIDIARVAGLLLGAGIGVGVVWFVASRR